MALKLTEIQGLVRNYPSGGDVTLASGEKLRLVNMYYNIMVSRWR